MSFATRVGAVAWAALDGAYGASGGDHDVAAALELLARDRDPDSDERMNARDLLASHVWHQGSIYAVTSHVVPFLLELAIEQPEDEELAELVILIAAAATRDRGPHGDAVLTAFGVCRDALLRWNHHHAEVPLALAPATRQDFFARVQEDPHDSLRMLLLAALPAVPPELLAHARELVGGVDDPPSSLRAAAALAVTAHGSHSADTDRDVRTALALQSLRELDDDLQLLGIDRPPPTAIELDGLVDADVVLANKYWLRIRFDRTEHMLRWPIREACTAARVRVGLRSDRTVYVVEYLRADGEYMRVPIG